MKKTFLLLSAFAFFIGACAGGGKIKSDPADAASPNTPAKALLAEKNREAKEKPPVKTGTDVIVDADPDVIWPILIKVEDWGSWMSKVTKVEPGAGLSPGALIKWQWEEKSIESEIVSVKENEEFAFKSCASTKKALVKWTLKSMAAKKTLVSLRAAVPYGTASEVMDKLGPEMTSWILALKAEASKEKGGEENDD